MEKPSDDFLDAYKSLFTPEDLKRPAVKRAFDEAMKALLGADSSNLTKRAEEIISIAGKYQDAGITKERKEKERKEEDMKEKLIKSLSKTKGGIEWDF